MIEGFWQSLLRVNARGVFLLTGLLLVLLGYWTLVREWPARSAVEGHETPSQIEEEPIEGTARLAFGDRLPTAWSNPFSSTFLKRAVEREKAEKVRELAEARKAEAEKRTNEDREKVEAAKKQAEKPPAQKKKPVPAKAAAKPQKKPAKQAKKPQVAKKVVPPARKSGKSGPIVLVYRGLMTRTDGTTVALIENKTSGKVDVFKRGDIIEKLHIDEFTRDRITLVMEDNTCHILEAGQQKKVGP